MAGVDRQAKEANSGVYNAKEQASHYEGQPLSYAWVNEDRLVGNVNMK